MNLLLISKISDRDLYKTSRYELLEALRRRKHNALLIMGKDIGEVKPKDKNIIYLPLIDFPILSGLLFSILLFFYLPILTKKEKIDAIIIDGNTVWLPSALIPKLSGIPLILDIRSLPIDNNTLLFDTSLFLSKFIVDGLTTITPELKEIIIKRYGLENKKIGVWSSGVSIEKFSIPSSTKKSNICSIASKHFTLMYHGSYSPNRGIENLINSITFLDEFLKSTIKLLILGSSPDEMRTLSNLCEKIKVENQVEFIQQVDYESVPFYILLCDVGIIPLPPENIWWQVSSPLKTLEYLAMGKAIIATNIPFHQRIFEKGECGILLTSNHPKELAFAIKYLYQNREKLNEMGKKGKEIVEKYYTWDASSLDLEIFIKKIVLRN